MVLKLRSASPRRSGPPALAGKTSAAIRTDRGSSARFPSPARSSQRKRLTSRERAPRSRRGSSPRRWDRPGPSPRRTGPPRRGRGQGERLGGQEVDLRQAQCDRQPDLFPRSAPPSPAASLRENRPGLWSAAREGRWIEEENRTSRPPKPAAAIVLYAHVRGHLARIIEDIHQQVGAAPGVPVAEVEHQRAAGTRSRCVAAVPMRLYRICSMRASKS